MLNERLLVARDSAFSSRVAGADFIGDFAVAWQGILLGEPFAQIDIRATFAAERPKFLFGGFATLGAFGG